MYALMSLYALVYMHKVLTGSEEPGIYALMSLYAFLYVH